MKRAHKKPVKRKLPTFAQAMAYTSRTYAKALRSLASK